MLRRLSIKFNWIVFGSGAPLWITLSISHYILLYSASLDWTLRSWTLYYISFNQAPFILPPFPLLSLAKPPSVSSFSPFLLFLLFPLSPFSPSQSSPIFDTIKLQWHNFSESYIIHQLNKFSVPMDDSSLLELR